MPDMDVITVKTLQHSADNNVPTIPPGVKVTMDAAEARRLIRLGFVRDPAASEPTTEIELPGEQKPAE